MRSGFNHLLFFQFFSSWVVGPFLSTLISYDQHQDQARAKVDKLDKKAEKASAKAKAKTKAEAKCKARGTKTAKATKEKPEGKTTPMKRKRGKGEQRAHTPMKKPAAHNSPKRAKDSRLEQALRNLAELNKHMKNVDDFELKDVSNFAKKSLDVIIYSCFHVPASTTFS